MASWPTQLRGLYEKAYQKVVENARKQVRGGNVRELHNAVFDILTIEKGHWWRGESRVWGVGSGVGLYAFIGRFIPEVCFSLKRFVGTDFYSLSFLGSLENRLRKDGLKLRKLFEY